MLAKGSVCVFAGSSQSLEKIFKMECIVLNSVSYLNSEHRWEVYFLFSPSLTLPQGQTLEELTPPSPFLESTKDLPVKPPSPLFLNQPSSLPGLHPSHNVRATPQHLFYPLRRISKATCLIFPWIFSSDHTKNSTYPFYKTRQNKIYVYFKGLGVL